jgi:hypothetical protein
MSCSHQVKGYAGEGYWAGAAEAEHRKDRMGRQAPLVAHGAAAVTNNVVSTTTYNGYLYAFNAATGAILLKTPLSAGTNAPSLRRRLRHCGSRCRTNDCAAAHHRLQARSQEQAP